MVTPITTSRQFRKGRALHSTSYPFDVVLVDSPSPRLWVAVEVNKKTGVWSIRKNTSKELRSIFTTFSNGIEKPLDRDERDRAIRQLESFPFSVKKVEWRVTSTLSRKGGIPRTGATVSSPLFAPGVEVPSSPDDIEEIVDPLVKAEVESAKKVRSSKRETVFIPPKLPTTPYWYESDNDRKLLRDFIALKKSGFTVNLMVSGPSGSGKTVGIQRLGVELDMPVHIVNCQAITTPEKWIGQMMADPSVGTHFVPSQHVQWVEAAAPECEKADNCILLYDEITRLRPELNNMTYSLFDTQRGLEVPQMGRRVRMHEKNLIISTANIGAAFAGTFGQDRAFRERFSMTMEREFPPIEEEIKILISATGIDKDKAKTLTHVAYATRNLWKDQTIEQPISTRTLVTWALLVAGGYTVMQGAEYTVLPLYSEDGGVESDRARVRLQIEGKAA